MEWANDPMAKRHTHLGVYALATHHEGLILIRKGRGPYRGSWDLPGGRIEFGESPRDALVREVSEETGLVVVDSKLIDVVSTRFTYELPDGTERDLHHIGVLYRVTVESVDGLKVEADGHDSLGSQLFSIDEVHALDLTPFARLAIEAELL